MMYRMMSVLLKRTGIEESLTDIEDVFEIYSRFGHRLIIRISFASYFHMLTTLMVNSIEHHEKRCYPFGLSVGFWPQSANPCDAELLRQRPPGLDSSTDIK
jgi:hypothetical protein